MSFIHDIQVRTQDCDMNGHWKPSAILESMQDVAILHCESLRLGRDTMDALGVAWVLSRCHVEFTRLPRNLETLSLETYAMPKRHLLYRRAHVFRDASGQAIGAAQGYWVLLNLKTRTIEPNPTVDERLVAEPLDAPVGPPHTVRALGDMPVSQALTPQFTEYDINGHVNNARYLDWCWNALGRDRLDGREIAGFDINYDSEILPGEVVRTELCLDGDRFSFCGFSGDKRRFGIDGQLRPNPGH